MGRSSSDSNFIINEISQKNPPNDVHQKSSSREADGRINGGEQETQLINRHFGALG